MFLYIPFLVISILSSFFAVFFRKKIENTFPLTSLFIIFIVFIGGLFRNLSYSLIFIWIISALCLVYLLWQFFIDSNNVKHLVFRPGLLIMFFVVIISYFWHYHNIVNTADELVQWALTVKTSFITNLFSCCPTYKGGWYDYPPGVELFHYFWVKSIGSFDDSYLYVSMNILVTSFLILPLQKFSLKLDRQIVLVILSLLLMPYIFYTWIYNLLLVDGLMGIIFGWLLYIYFSNRQKLDYFYVLLLSLGFFVLPLVKSLGILFAIGALSIIIIDYLLLFYKSKGISHFFRFIPIIFSLFISDRLWKFIIKSFGVPQTWMFNLDTVDYIKTSLLPWQKLAFVNFYKSIFNYRILSNTTQTEYHLGPIHVSLIIWLLLLLFFLFVIYRLYNKQGKIFFILLYIGLILYIPVNSLFYLVIFGEGENSILSSFSRYINTYLIGILLFCVFLIIDKLEKASKILTIKISIILLFIIFASYPKISNTPLILFDKLNRDKNEELYLARTNYRSFVAQLHPYLPVKSTILYNLYGTYDFRYDILPIKVATPVWQNFGFDEFEKSAKRVGYTHVFFEGNVNSVESPEFEKQFGRLFLPGSIIKNRGLYEVTWVNEIPMLKFITQIN